MENHTRKRTESAGFGRSNTVPLRYVCNVSRNFHAEVQFKTVYVYSSLIDTVTVSREMAQAATKPEGSVQLTILLIVVVIAVAHVINLATLRQCIEST